MVTLCEHVMRRVVETVATTDTVQDAARRMREHDIGVLPVVDEVGRVVGIVSDRDLALRVCAEDYRSSEVPVSSVMTPDPISCAPEHRLRRAEALMELHKKSRILIVGADRTVRGIVSLSDVAQFERPSRVSRILFAIASRKFSPERP